MSLFSSFFGPDINEISSQERAIRGSVLLDVRTPDEFRAGHIEGALNVPLVALPSTAPQRLPDKTAPIFVYCLSGARSTQACRELERQGYSSVTNMGGIDRWSGPLTQ